MDSSGRSEIIAKVSHSCPCPRPYHYPFFLNIFSRIVWTAKKDLHTTLLHNPLRDFYNGLCNRSFEEVVAKLRIRSSFRGNCKSLYVLKEAFTRSRAKRALECGEFIHRFVIFNDNNYWNNKNDVIELSILSFLSLYRFYR